MKFKNAPCGAFFYVTRNELGCKCYIGMNHFKSYFLMLAQYNLWANQKIFHVLDHLSEAQLHQDCGGYFKSLLQTANHLLVGDILWFERVNGLTSSNLALDQVLYPSLTELSRARKYNDAAWISFIDACSEEALMREKTYLRRGQYYSELLVEILAHVFNHQTHHRGQMHHMIYQFTGQSLELDLIFFQREHVSKYHR